MIPTLRVSHLINKNNYLEIPGVEALEYTEVRPLFKNGKKRLFHSGYGIVQREFLGYFDSIIDFLNGNNFDLFSFDLGPASEEVEYVDFSYRPVSKVLKRAELRNIFKERLRFVKNLFKGTVALENLNYFHSPAYSTVCESGFIKETIEENNVFFVLDIAHAVISAENLGMDVIMYLSSLPLHKVIGIHLSRPGTVEGEWRDLHGNPGEEEYKLLRFVLTRTAIRPFIVLEYDNSLFEIIEAYKKIKILIDSEYGRLQV